MTEELTMKEIQAQFEKQNKQIADLQKAMQLSDAAPASMQIAYSPELQTRVFEKAPYFRFLESKGRVDDNFSSTYAAFYLKNSSGVSQFINEDDDIPAAVASSYEEKMEKMKTLIYPIDVSMLSQMGNNVVDLIQSEIQDGFIKVTNDLDNTLLQGTGVASDKDFKGFVNQVTTNKETLTDEPITEDLIDDMLTDIIDQNNGTPDVIVTTNLVAKQLKKIVAPYRRYNDKIDIGLGHRVVAYEAPNGAEIPILIDSNLESDSMLFVDSATIEVKRLLAPTLLTDLPTNKLGTRDAIVSFVTAQNVAEYKNGLITGIADPSP